MRVIRRATCSAVLLLILTMPATAGATSLQQKNAIAAAKQYLKIDAFSRLGLIQQLHSPAGSGFPKAVATYAVNHIKVNWYAEAVKAAKGYLKIDSFSCSGLVQQLDSSAGGQFTKAQAVYAAKAVHLC